MSAYYPAVMAQVDFACSVLGFIKRLLRAVVHTTHNLESVRRRKKLDAQRDGRRKEDSQPPPKNGKMAGVKTTGKR